MSRLPFVPTLVVAAAAATMMWLGVWQLHRLQWKEGLLARYAAAQGMQSVPFPQTPDRRNLPLFRRASALCQQVIGWRAESGRNASDDAGWIHVASCRRREKGPGFQAVMGWSALPSDPSWQGGPVNGVIGTDRAHLIRLIATNPAPGLQAAKPPSLDAVSNNHLIYAIQWFFFAGAAVVIYILALAKRSR